MKLSRCYQITKQESEQLEFPDELWQTFKDSKRDDEYYPDHEDNVRYEYEDEFIDWLHQLREAGDKTIKFEVITYPISMEYVDSVWGDSNV